MIHASGFQSWRKCFLAVICVILAACSAMQKSSTGSGDQAAAPISEAEKPDASTGKSPNSTGAAGPSNSNPAIASGADVTNAGSKRHPSEGRPASGDNNDEAAQLKRQLAEQDAQINKLRSDQQVSVDPLPEVRQEEPAATREAMDAAMSDQQAAASAKDQSASAGPASLSREQDELAVFPRDGRTADDLASQPVVAPVPERSVFFGYDQVSVSDKYDSLLVAHAAYLKAHPDFIVEVQGNCDERGSREYNLALGARRAESVKRALELAGADGSRISAISYGSEKPLSTGKDEESYSRNRRVDIVY